MKKFIAGFMIVLLVLGFALADVFEAGSVTIDDTKYGPAVPDINSGKSVIYYIKNLNLRLINSVVQTSSAPSAEEVASDIKQSEKEPVLSDAPKATVASAGASITWANLLGTQDNILVFPRVNVSGKDYVLKLNFTKSKWSGIKYLKVYVNESPVKCYYDTWGSIWDAFGEVNALVYGWGEAKETCDYSISNQFVVTTSLTAGDPYYSIRLTSPIIPSSCNGKSISQSQSTTNASC